MLFISGGLKAIVTAIEKVYPKVKYQSFCVHVARNIAHKVGYLIRQASVDFKAVYRAEEISSSLEKML